MEKEIYFGRFLCLYFPLPKKSMCSSISFYYTLMSNQESVWASENGPGRHVEASSTGLVRGHPCLAPLCPFPGHAQLPSAAHSVRPWSPWVRTAPPGLGGGCDAHPEQVSTKDVSPLQGLCGSLCPRKLGVLYAPTPSPCILKRRNAELQRSVGCGFCLLGRGQH